MHEEKVYKPSPRALQARPAGFEPAACALEERCSNPLSYGRISWYNSFHEPYT